MGFENSSPDWVTEAAKRIAESETTKEFIVVINANYYHKKDETPDLSFYNIYMSQKP